MIGVLKVRDDQSYVNKEDIKRLNKIVDKLEQRISTLEKTTLKKEQPKQLAFNFNQDQPLLVELNK